MSDPAIAIERLGKTFRSARKPWSKKRREKVALVDVDLTVSRGELVTLIGPNGAGKTTLLKILSTLITPTTGSARVLGFDVMREPARVRAEVGYVLAEDRSFYWRLTVRENLEFFATLAAVDDTSRIDELSALFGLGELLDTDYQDLSLGQKQSVAIVRGLVSDPSVVLFDEATRSLDPARAQRMRTTIRERLVERKNKAVLFATHDLEEARMLSDRALLMVDGRVAAIGPFEKIEPEIREAFDREARHEDEEFRRAFGDSA